MNNTEYADFAKEVKIYEKRRVRKISKTKSKNRIV